MGRAVLVTLALALAAPAAGAPAVSAASGPPAAPGASAAQSCPKSGTVARIAGKRTCLAKGRACSSRYKSQYKAKGYNCSKGRLKKIKQEF